MRMWLLLTLYLVLSAIASCFILSACLLSGRISRREEARARAMHALSADIAPTLENQREADRGFRPALIKSIVGGVKIRA
jgi:hypothetical protein